MQIGRSIVPMWIFGFVDVFKCDSLGYLFISLKKNLSANWWQTNCYAKCKQMNVSNDNNAPGNKCEKIPWTQNFL